MKAESTRFFFDEGKPVLYWCWQSLSDLPDDDKWLCESEIGVLSRLKFQKRRQDWRLGRWVSKLAVSRCLGAVPLPLNVFEVRAAPDGAPELFLRGKPAGLSLSISHSEENGICAVGPAGICVGCDLEKVRPRAENFIRDFFRTEEIRWLDGHPAGQRPLLSILIWSAKESALKVVREGMRRDTRSVIVSADTGNSPEAWNRLSVRCAQSGREFPGWWRTRGDFVMTLLAGKETLCPRQIRVT